MSATQYQFNIRDLITSIVDRYSNPLPYGKCPICGANGVTRERRLNGNDRCENDHEYPSASAVMLDEYARKHKPAAGQLGLFEKPSEKQKPLFSKSVDDEAGRWVTMRGARVYISNDDGRIMKGPKKLIGKTKEQIEKESAEEEVSPKPKPLNEMGRISGGRADNRQKKLFEELNPGFKFEDDEEEDFKTVEPVAMAEVPSSPADDVDPISALTDNVLHLRLGHRFEQLQLSLGVKKPAMGKQGTKNVQDALRKIPGGNVIAAMLATGSEHGHLVEFDSNGFPQIGNDAFQRVIDGKFSREDLNAAKEFLETNYSNSSEFGNVNQYRWLSGVARVAKPKPVESEEPEFTLDSTPAPSPAKPTDFSNPDAATKQGALFDTGKGTGDLKGQELLFNSDAGDLNNPKTMENRAKSENEQPKPAAELHDIAKKAGLKNLAQAKKKGVESLVSNIDSGLNAMTAAMKPVYGRLAPGIINHAPKEIAESLIRNAMSSGNADVAFDRALEQFSKKSQHEGNQLDSIVIDQRKLVASSMIRNKKNIIDGFRGVVPESKQEDGPQDGDTNEAGLVFRNGRWHRDGEEINPADIAAKARENGESIWTAAKRELGLNSMGEIPPELRKELGDAMAATSAGKAPEVKPPSPGRQRAMERQEEKQKEEEQAAVKPAEASIAAPEPEPVAPVTEAEESGDTPREQAGHYYDTQNHNEYAWARESEVSNAGKDLIGSARHKRNEWRTLEELEERGSAVAEELITRSNLMKHNPPNLAIAAERNPITALAMHMALNSIPARPYGVKSGEVHVDTEKKKLARKLYVEAFDSLRAKAEELAIREDDPMKALSEFANHADQIRNTYKAQAGTYVGEQFNHMVTIHNRTQTSLRGGGYLDLNRPVGRRDKSTDASTQIRKFAALARENYGPDWMESEDVQEKAIDVITGSSIDKVFDIAKDKSASGKYKFNPSEAYVTGKTERKGGPSVDTSSVKKSQNVLLDSLAVSGLQYGNSMTDDERKHHTAKTAEAMVDLADALGIPDKAVGMNGKLGIAFGARGRAGAKAHYEPNLNVINLTRKTGAGSLAHEWAHFVDYNTGEDGDKQQTKSRQGNQKALKESWEAARSRIMDAVSKAYSHLGSDSRWAQVRYWTSDEEMFARFSERMVQKKLHDQGRENSYLVGLQKNSHPFWPNDSELEKSMPHLEAIYKKFGEDFEKEHGKEPKKDRYSRIREVMDSIVDQYVRPEDDVIQITVDQYAHPLVHAAVGAGAMALANSAFKSGPLRSVAHAAIGAAMAAWMQSAMAANGIQPAQAPSSPAANAVHVSPAASPFMNQQAGNSIVNQIVQNAINQNAAKAQAAANAPPSPAQVSAHSISSAAAGKAGVPGVRPLTGGNAAGIPGRVQVVNPASPNQSQSAGKEGAESGKLPVTEPADGSGSGSFNADHPRHPAGATGSKGGEFAPKGGEESGSSSDESAPESSSSPAENSGTFDVWHSPKTSSSQGYSGAASAGLGDAFATDSHEYASQYGTPEKHTAKMQNPYQMSAAEFRDFDRGPDASFERSKAKRQELESAGHDGILVSHADGTKEHILFNRDNLTKQESSPRNYPDNLNKPASEQTDYSPPERSIETPAIPGKTPHTGERQSRKAAWEKHLQGMAQQVTEKKESAKAEKKQAKDLAKATSFNPAELSSPMADDIEPAGEAPKEEDFDSAKDYEIALEKHNRSKGAKQATIKKRSSADLIPEIAGQHDLNHDDLRAAVDEEVQMLLPYHNRKEEARQYISKMGWNARRINQAEDRGIDSSSTQFDHVASQWAGMFPEIAGSDESEWVARMWDLSKEGAQDPPSASDEELVNRVAKRLSESGASSSSAEEEGFEYADPGPVSGEIGDVDYTPFHRKAVVDLIVDRYMRLAGIA